MGVTEILREIDAEIRKLKRVREILRESLGTPAHPKRETKARKVTPHKPDRPVSVISLPVEAAVQITVVPPTREPERRRRIRVPAPMARAIDVVISEKPVFVPRSPVANLPTGPASPAEELDVNKLEATFRRSLFGSSGAVTSG